ncbi:MAG TPA: hypothetical protein PKL23_06330 [Candidatus Egerieousia sp.]|nr:hypothetical protein [Candidatus Egerieousia sp.]
MKNDFVKGDFVKLRNPKAHAISKIHNVNVFEIREIKNFDIALYDVEDLLTIQDIEAIQINGKDDKHIYYNPVVMADVCRPFEEPRAHITDKSYYMNAFKKNIYKERRLFDVIENKGFMFVHEVQHFLRENFHKSEMKIDSFCI